MRAWQIVDPATLKPHESVDDYQSKEAQRRILETGVIEKPVTVDRASSVIISGHACWQAVRELKLRKIPVRQVDYVLDREIQLCPTSTVLEKSHVISAGLSGRTYPSGSARHLFRGMPIDLCEPHCNLPLERLKTKVLTYGVFDLFHIGHANMLKAARALGDYLVVAVQYNAEKYKPERIYYTFEERIDIIRSLRYVDVAVGYERLDLEIERLSVEFEIDTFARGPEPNPRVDGAAEFCATQGMAVVTIPRTEGISATALRKGLQGIRKRGAPVGEGCDRSPIR